MSRYKQLSKEERFTIENMINEGYSASAVARTLSRSKSTISREIKRNKGRNGYFSCAANAKAEKRLAESHAKYAVRSPALRLEISELIQTGLSPMCISKRLKLEGRESVSHTAIYRWIRKEEPALEAYLYRSYHKPRRKHKARTSVIKGRVPIAHRPEGRESGQWESDLVVSRRSKAALQTCVERNSRYVRISPLRDHSANENSSVLIRALRGLPCSSIAYDNGIENVLHQKVNDALGCVSYFCEPYHSWEKGTIENRNGIIRQYLPKSTDFREISPEMIARIQDSINFTPMKCLGYKTPFEVQFKTVLSLEQIKRKVFSPKTINLFT